MTDALEAKFDLLPQMIQSLIYDHLCLGVIKGRGQAAIAAMESSLVGRDRAVYTDFIRSLTHKERSAIVSYLNGEQA